MTDEIVWKKFVYAGVRLNSKGQKFHVEYEVTEDNQIVEGTSTTWTTPRKGVGKRAVGEVWNVATLPDTGQYYSSGEHGPKVVGTFPGDERKEWAVLDRAAKLEFDRRKQVKGKAKDVLEDMTFAEFKRLYTKKTPAVRRAMTVALLDYLWGEL